MFFLLKKDKTKHTTQNKQQKQM